MYLRPDFCESIKLYEFKDGIKLVHSNYQVDFNLEAQVGSKSRIMPTLVIAQV